MPVMYAVLAEDTPMQRMEFEKFCCQNFKGMSAIYQIIYTDGIPKTGAGKKAFKRVREYDGKTFGFAQGKNKESTFVPKDDIW